MTYKELLHILGSDDAINAVCATLLRAGRFELTGFIMSEEEAQETFGDIYIDEKKYAFGDWGELREEISTNIRNCNGSQVQLKRYICSLLTPLEDIADYYDFDFSWPKDKWSAAFLVNKVSGMMLPSVKTFEEFESEAERKTNEYFDNLRHQRYLECDDEDVEEDDERFDYTTDEWFDMYDKFFKEENDAYDAEWKKPEYTLMFKVQYGLRNLGYIIEGALLENGVNASIFDYERECGVVLVRKVAPIDLVNAMNWTRNLAESYLPEEITYATKKTKWSEFPELQDAHASGIIDNRGRLKTTMSDFVRFCMRRKYFGQMHLKDWKPIDKAIINKSGSPITAAALKQSYQDICKIEPL